MSGRDGDAATDVMIGCLDEFGDVSRPLVVGEPSGQLADALRVRGAKPVQWSCLDRVKSGN